MVDRVAPREDIARLLTETMSSVELAINRLAIWAREGHRDAEKVGLFSDIIECFRALCRTRLFR